MKQAYSPVSGKLAGLSEVFEIQAQLALERSSDFVQSRSSTPASGTHIDIVSMEVEAEEVSLSIAVASAIAGEASSESPSEFRSLVLRRAG